MQIPSKKIFTTPASICVCRHRPVVVVVVVVCINSLCFRLGPFSTENIGAVYWKELNDTPNKQL